jgi:PAS domain-containing protein
VNLSLRGRVTSSFIIANVVVLALTFVVFHYLDSLNKDIESITFKSNRISILTDDIRISAVTLLKYQRKILITRPTTRQIDQIVSLCESFTSQLGTLESIYKNADAQKVVGQMLAYVDSLRLFLQKGALMDRSGAGASKVGELADKILESFSEFQDIQYIETKERDKKIKEIVSETKRHMMIVLIIGFLFTIILALIIPGKIALPFKKVKDAIRELQECNFDVSIYYSQNDEIGEIAREMNKMIHSFKVFEELRADRISVENRKFDALANLVRRPVLVTDANGKLIYLNGHSYQLLEVQSEDVIGKEMNDTVIPTSIIESYELAIKRRSKIENIEVKILAKHKEGVEPVDGEQAQVVLDENGEVVRPEPVYAYEGYANVIPIRGKESSLDYYLMVLSKNVFN